MERGSGLGSTRAPACCLRRPRRRPFSEQPFPVDRNISGEDTGNSTRWRVRSPPLARRHRHQPSTLRNCHEQALPVEGISGNPAAVTSSVSITFTAPNASIKCAAADEFPNQRSGWDVFGGGGVDDLQES